MSLSELAVVRGDEPDPTFPVIDVIAAAPEIDIRGNGLSIEDGDTTPSLADHTDFGDAAVPGGHVDRTFRIWNLGDATLDLTYAPPIFIIPHSSGFSIVAGGNTFSLAPGGYDDFTVRFSPSASGVASATVQIGNSDSDEHPYDFVIQGTGVYPEIDLYGNGIEIPAGDTTPSLSDHTDFGAALVDGGTVDRTFQIWNNSISTLTLTYGPPIFLTLGQGFSVVASPGGFSVSPGTHEDFTLRFDPSGTGTFTATVTIGNDDPDEHPYEFLVRGRGAQEILYLPLVLR